MDSWRTRRIWIVVVHSNDMTDMVLYMTTTECIKGSPAGGVGAPYSKRQWVEKLLMMHETGSCYYANSSFIDDITQIKGLSLER